MFQLADATPFILLAVLSIRFSQVPQLPLTLITFFTVFALAAPIESTATSKIITQLIGECFSPKYVAVVNGGREENSSLLEQPFDYIFFTGSPAIGHVVMKSASKHLTPVTLELGGKSPCIVDSSAKLSLAAKRIVFGRGRGFF